MIQAPYAAVALANDFQFGPGVVRSAGPVQSRMLLFCSRGRGQVSVNAKRFDLEQGALLFLPWNRSIEYAAATVDPFLVCGVHIIPWYDPAAHFTCTVPHARDHAGFDSPARRDADLGPLEGDVHGTIADDSTLVSLVKLVVADFQDAPFDRLTATAWAQVLLAKLAAWASLPASEHRPARVEEELVGRVESYVLAHLSEELTLADLASVAATSPSTLARHFDRLLRVTPYEWVLSVRMDEAKRRLVSSSAPVHEVARAVGFADPAYFARTFRKRTDRTPTRYRSERAGV